MPFEAVKSETVYRGRAFNVRKDQVSLPNGELARLDIVDHVGAVTIIPLDDSGHLWLVRQYRHAARKFLLEIPAGTLDEGEDPAVCALRELREETGMAAHKIVKIGEFFLAPGYSTEYMHVYLATGLYPDPLPGDNDEFLTVEKIPFDLVKHYVQSGEIQDAKSLAALYLMPPARL